MVRMLHGLGAVAWLVAAARAATNCSDGSWSTPRDELGARFLDYGGIEAAAGQRLGRRQKRAYGNLVARMSAREDVLVVALGGSMMAGRMCADKAQTAAVRCSYPNQLADVLRRKYYGADPGGDTSRLSSGLVFRNLAMYGMTTMGMLPQLAMTFSAELVPGRSAPDLVVVDFGVNDAYAIENAWAGLHKTANATASYAEVYGATEALVRFVLRDFPETALLISEAPCWATWSFDAHRAAAARYGVPVVALKDAIAGGACHDAWPTNTMKRAPHPAAPTHSLVASALATWFCMAFEAPGDGALEDALDAALAAPPAAPGAARFAVCDPQLSVYDARAALGDAKAPRPRAAGGWRLYEDRPDKPGWISERSGAVLDFDLRLGASPRIAVVFTKGYEGFGAARLTMGNVSTVVDAHHAVRVTQSELLVLNAASAADGIFGWKNFGLEPHSTTTLRVETTGDAKFKIQVVASC